MQVGVGKNRNSQSIYVFIACCQWRDHQVLYAQLRSIMTAALVVHRRRR